MAKRAVNGWFADLVSSAAKPILELLQATVLGTPEIASSDMDRARDLWGVSQTIANTCYVLVITAAGVWLLAGHGLPGTEVTPGQLVGRLVAAFVASNCSLTVIGYAITFANALSGAFLTTGSEAIDPRVVADTIAGSITMNTVYQQQFLAFVALGVIVLALCVGFIYVVRIVITMVLIAAAPLALMFHSLPITDGLARLWWRGMTGILAIQVCQSLVLATAFRLLFTKTRGSGDSFLGIPARSEVTDLLLALCLLWVMVRIPSWVARTIWRAATPRSAGRMLRSLILYRGLGALMGSRRAIPTPRRYPRPGPRPTPTPLPPPPVPPHPVPPPPPAPTPTPPQPAPPPGEGPEGDTDRSGGGRPMQLTLPIPIPPKAAGKRPVQLALPMPVTRTPRPSAPSPSAGSAPSTGRAARPPAAGRGRQLMLPGMPRRPVPHRQLTLWIEPPKRRGRT